MSYNAKRATRKSAKPVAVVKEKFVEANESRLNEFVPSPAQREFISTINENTITFCDSCAGSGKTSAALWTFCKQYLADRTKEIVIVRTPVEFTDDKIGFLPNALDAKLEPHFASARAILEDFLGKGRVESDLDKRIHFKVPNYLLGATISDSLILIDESQQMSPMILKLLLERVGENCVVVVAGSSHQLFETTSKRNALADALQRFFTITDDYVEPKYDMIGFHEFSVEDVMRSEIVKSVIKAYS
jgi:phosphate starvation-inducible PhoH-like protein